MRFLCLRSQSAFQGQGSEVPVHQELIFRVSVYQEPISLVPVSEEPFVTSAGTQEIGESSPVSQECLNLSEIGVLTSFNFSLVLQG